jgi:hypothetical protein
MITELGKYIDTDRWIDDPKEGSLWSTTYTYCCDGNSTYHYILGSIDNDIRDIMLSMRTAIKLYTINFIDKRKKKSYIE